MNDLKQQLAPGWSTVNIIIIVVLFTLSWPLALIYLAYVLWGQKVRLDLSKPETVATFGRRVVSACKAGIDSFTKS